VKPNLVSRRGSADGKFTIPRKNSILGNQDKPGSSKERRGEGEEASTASKKSNTRKKNERKRRKIKQKKLIQTEGIFS
jgi:hypothetical protein